MREGPAEPDRVDSGISDVRDPRGYLDAVLETVVKRVVHIVRTRTIEGREPVPSEPRISQAGQEEDVLSRLRGTLEALDRARTRDEVLDALLGGLGWAYDRAAIFLQRGAVLEGWRSACRGPAVEVGTLAFPLTLDSVLTRAFDQPASHLDRRESGLFGTGLAATFAAPIRTAGRTIGVAYAELGEAVPVEAVRFAAAFGRLLMDVANRHLGRVSSSRSEAGTEPEQPPQPLAVSIPTYPGPARRAPRIRVREGFQITVQGQAAQLIDVSSRGAQVVIAQRVRPNQRLTLTLPNEASQIVCKGQVIWARFEQPTNGETRYRIGLELVEVEASAIEAFVAYCSQNAPIESDVPIVDQGAGTQPRRRVG